MESDLIINAINQLSLLSPDDSFESLTKQMVELIKANIDCYFVGIFLLNEQKNNLHFIAGSGATGDKLFRSGWRLPISNVWMQDTILVGDISLINCVTQEKLRYKIYETSYGKRELQHRISESIFLPGQLLPGTKWHLFLPLRNQAGVFGVLELQSPEERGFEVDDFLSLLELTDKVASKLDFGEGD